MIQEGNTSSSHEMDQIEGNKKNLPHNTDDDQIQLNSMKFNENQWISMDINEYQLISTKFNENQLISTDISEFQQILTDITRDQQEDD